MGEAMKKMGEAFGAATGKKVTPVDFRELKALLPERSVVEAEGLRIGRVHDAGPAQGRHARRIEWFPGCDVVAYGHTPLPEVARHGNTWIGNPGSPTERRRAPGHCRRSGR